MPTFSIYEVAAGLRGKVEALENEMDPIKTGIIYLLTLRLEYLESCLETIRHRKGDSAELEGKIKEVKEKIVKIAGQ